MMLANGCCSWEATSASRIYGTKLKNLLMGRGSSNNTSRTGQGRMF